MVLQRYLNLKIWGSADPGEKLTVSYKEPLLKTKADKTGNSSIEHKLMDAGEPYEMSAV